MGKTMTLINIKNKDYHEKINFVIKLKKLK